MCILYTYVDICTIMHKHVNNDLHLREFKKKKKRTGARRSWRSHVSGPQRWRQVSWPLSTEEEDKSFVPPTFISGAFRVFCPGFFCSLLLRHGESVPGDPAAAAGREESRREGGRSPQAWVGEAAWEPPAAAPASTPKRVEWNNTPMRFNQWAINGEKE